MRAASVKRIAPGTILLAEGDIATKLFLVICGCLRTYFIKEDGKDITAQFFVEDQMVASFESAATGTQSRAYIEAIEDSIIAAIPLKTLEKIRGRSTVMREVRETPQRQARTGGQTAQTLHRFLSGNHARLTFPYQKQAQKENHRN